MVRFRRKKVIADGAKATTLKVESDAKPDNATKAIAGNAEKPREKATTQQASKSSDAAKTASNAEEALPTQPPVLIATEPEKRQSNVTRIVNTPGLSICGKEERQKSGKSDVIDALIDENVKDEKNAENDNDTVGSDASGGGDTRDKYSIVFDMDEGNSVGDDDFSKQTSPQQDWNDDEKKSKRRKKNAEARKQKEKDLRALHTLATKHLRAGAYKQALENFSEILRIHIRLHGDEHPRVGSALHNIAIVHLRDGTLDDAVDAIEEAIRVKRRALGGDSPKVADSLVEMGIILLSRKEFHGSLEAFNEALDIMERNFGEEDIRVAKILNNLGCVYFEFGDLVSAEKTFEDTVEMQRSILAASKGDKPGSLSIMSTLCNMGYVYLEQAKYYDAIVVLDEALSIQQSILKPDNKLILNTLDNLGYACGNYGDYDKAVKHYEDLIGLQIATRGKLHIECSETLMKLAHVHIKLYEWEEANVKLVRAQEIQQMHLSPNHRKIIKTRRLLNEVTYQILKYPTLGERIVTLMANCGMRNPLNNRLICSGSAADEEVIENLGRLKRPRNSSKMSGHKLTYA